MLPLSDLQVADLPQLKTLDPTMFDFPSKQVMKDHLEDLQFSGNEVELMQYLVVLKQSLSCHR